MEIQFPYRQSAAELRQLLDGNGLRLVLFNVDADTLLQGGEGLAAVPEKRQNFRRAVDQALRYAELLQPCAINVLPGRCLNADRLAEYRATFLENLDYAARAFAGQGIVTVFEAVNSFDMPGFILDSSAQMLQVLHDLNHPHLRLQYDIYHMSRMGEDCAEFLRCHIDRIGISSSPIVRGGRNPAAAASIFRFCSKLSAIRLIPAGPAPNTVPAQRPPIAWLG